MLSLTPPGAAGSFGIVGHVHRDLTRQQLSWWRLSDYLPLWVEFTY